MLNVLASIVKLASSSNSPSTPTITILLSVKSSTLTLANVDWPSTSNVPSICVFPLDCCTVKLPCPILNSVASNVKFASSSISPSTPTITILLSVKSSTLTLANVDCPSTCNVPLIRVSPVA